MNLFDTIEEFDYSGTYDKSPPVARALWDRWMV